MNRPMSKDQVRELSDATKAAVVAYRKCLPDNSRENFLIFMDGVWRIHEMEQGK